MILGKVSRSEEKRDNGDEAVEAKIQSNIAGTAAGGTCRKLLDNEVM